MARWPPPESGGVATLVPASRRRCQRARGALLRMPAGLSIRVIDVHRRQVMHLLLRHAEPDTILDASHGADRDRHLLAAPQVPLLEEHVGHAMIAGIDDESLDPANFSVLGVDS